MSPKTDVTLKNFFVFIGNHEAKEGEEQDKILYYYPETDEINAQIRNLGLVEALIKFTGNFKPNKPVNSLHTLKKRQLYYQPEDNYWMVMTLNLPYVSKTKNSTCFDEYLEDDVQDTVYQSVLKQAYLMFRLFNGTFSECAHLKRTLNTFYGDYTKNMRLVNADVLDVFAGINFLPLSTRVFLNVQSFVSLVESASPFVRSVSFLYNDGLIWSGIDPPDAQLIYHYLIRDLLPEHLETELQGGSLQRNSHPFASLHYGRFVIGPANLKSGEFVGEIPKVYLGYDEVGKHAEDYYLVVYRALSSTVCLYVDGKTQLSLAFFQELDDLLGPRLSILASNIAEYCLKHVPNLTTDTSSNAPRFVYFNKLNLAYKSSIHLDNRGSGNLACSGEILRIIGEMNAKKGALGCSGEVIVKTTNDYWIVGKVFNLREFYVVLQQKNATLIDISDEVKKVCDTELKGIFFHA